MPTPDETDLPASAQETQWSLVLAAGSTDSGIARPALDRLCRAHWGPLRAFVRRQGFSLEDSEDIIQGFFLSLLQHDYLRRVDRARGRFRSFLYASLRHYIYNHLDHLRARKRGGGVAPLSLQALAENENGPWEPGVTPETDRVFDREWALELLQAALADIESSYAGSGRADLFASVKPYLANEVDEAGYAAPAAALGLSEGAYKVAVHRARDRFRLALRRRIAETVANEADVDDEFRYLLHAVAG